MAQLTLAQFSPFGGGELLLSTADGRLRTYDSGKQLPLLAR